tara:strand:+ start:16 stop:252 length:237 start_codon:yes stop_codon:yes gene_type:complete
MPQIGWLEILSVVIIAILVLGPKEFPVALKKIGSYIGKFKNTLSNFQKEVSSATQEIDFDKEATSQETDNKKKIDKNG